MTSTRRSRQSPRRSAADRDRKQRWSDRRSADEGWAWTSGIAEIDELIEGVRAGDNIVWITGPGVPTAPFIDAFLSQVARPSLLAYAMFRPPDTRLARQLKKLGQSGAVLLDCLEAPHDGVLSTLAQVPVRRGAGRTPATFLVELSEVEHQLGQRAGYVFDDLTAMAARWGVEDALEIFLTACPRLYELRTVAYWIIEQDAVPRSFVERVTATTQVAISVAKEGETLVATLMKADGRPDELLGGSLTFLPQDGALVVTGRFFAPGAGLGDLIRGRRVELGLSQAQVADRIGVTASALSQVERGVHGLSSETLLRVLDALGIQVGTGPERAHPPYTFSHRTARHPTRIGEMEVDTLFRRRGFDAHIATLPPGEEGQGSPFATKRAELILVLAGIVVLKLGKKSHALSQGDAFLLTDTNIDSWQNPSPNPTRLFWMALPPGSEDVRNT